MKQVILIVILAVGGYFGYQYYVDSSQESTPADTSNQDSTFIEYLPPIPDDCENKGKNFADAIYGNDIGRVSFSQRNFAQRAFQSCLVDAGFTDSQISRTVGAIKEDVKSLNPGSARGY